MFLKAPAMRSLSISLGLALLGALSGMSSAQADPGDECCGMPKHEDCNGCVGPYLIDGGVLFGCTTASIAADCNITSQVCATVIGPAQRWKRGSNCTIPNGIVAPGNVCPCPPVPMNGFTHRV